MKKIITHWIEWNYPDVVNKRGLLYTYSALIFLCCMAVMIPIGVSVLFHLSIGNKVLIASICMLTGSMCHLIVTEGLTTDEIFTGGSDTIYPDVIFVLNNLFTLLFGAFIFVWFVYEPIHSHVYPINSISKIILEASFVESFLYFFFSGYITLYAYRLMYKKKEISGTEKILDYLK